jgi:hypothetical protein
LLLLAVFCGLLIPGSAYAFTPPPIKHVFVLIDENESASTTFGPGSPAPYLSQTLVSQGAFIPNYYGIGHSSLDNYIAMVSGQAPNPSTSGDCPNFVNFPADSMDASGQENGAGCVYPTDVPTLMAQLDARGLSWRAYEDGMGADPAREPATCGHPAVGGPDNTEGATAADQYATRHDPFVYFHYLIDNQAECDANVVNLSQLPTDLASAATTPNFVFITPNLCDDGHDANCANGGPGGLGQADTFLRTWVPKITSSPAFAQNGLLIITFDEAAPSDASACCGELPGPDEAKPGGTGPGGGDVGAVLLSPFIAAGTQSTASYNHYSMLGSVEDIFSLPRIAYAVGTTPFGSDVYTQPNGPVAIVAPTLPPVLPPAAPKPATPPSKPVSISRAQLLILLSREITPSAGAGRIAKLVKNHGFSLSFKALEGGRAVQWYQVPKGAKLAKVATPTLVASGQTTFGSAGTKTIKISLTGAGKRLLKHPKGLKLTAKGTFTPTGAKPVSANKIFTLKP